MSEIKVNSIKGVAASTAAITVNNSDGTCTANITNNLSNRNLIINGAMQVAQRGTSSTTNGFGSVDRFSVEYNAVDEASTQAQVDVASGTTPYTLGFRKALRITNGNQTSGVGNGDYIQIYQRVEAQNMATSGWNYVSSSSFITLSFYIKSSVAQAFSGSLRSHDGTSYSYKFDTPSLSADTWTKVTKTIPGNSNLTFNNDNGNGLSIYLYPFIGTTYTSANSNTETWITSTSSTYANDMTSTWYTTNDATFEITGVQLEVGSVATDFEHLSFADELRRCERYCETIAVGEGDGAYISNAVAYATNQMYSIIRFRTPKRATNPTLVQTTGTNYYVLYRNGGSVYSNDFSGTSWPNIHGSAIYNSMNCTDGDAGLLGSSNSGAKLLFTSEL